MDGREYLAFTKKERKGIALLLLVLIGVIFLPRILEKNDPGSVIMNEVAKEERVWGEAKVTTAADTAEAKRNTPQSLRFASKKYSMPEQASVVRQAKPQQQSKKKIEPFEINQADTSAFIALPMIGSKLAQRIVTFREKLGGFVHVHQVGEVYGVNDTVFRIIQPYLWCNKALARKIRINTADAQALASHPYIRWHLANAIVNFRSQHGNFNSLRDLEQIHNIDSSALRKLEMYITFEHLN